MKILSIGILRYNADTPEPVMLSMVTELSNFGFFQRGTVREMLTFFNKTIAKRTPPGQRQSVQNEDGLCGSITCDAEYPPRVAFSLLTRLLEDFSSFKPDWVRESRNEAVQWPQLESDILKYQDPANADQIMKIQRSLDETRDVLHNTIDSVLQRGEKLEDLVERSGELSAQSKLFYREAKRANSCCAVV